MLAAQLISDTDRKLRDAMDIWAEWVKRPTESLGYGHCVGFNTSNVSGWDDFERKVDKNMAISVQALYEGLTHPQQLAIDHFHLSAVWKSNRTNIEDDYADGLAQIEKGLLRRGLI